MSGLSFVGEGLVGLEDSRQKKRVRVGGIRLVVPDVDGVGAGGSGSGSVGTFMIPPASVVMIQLPYCWTPSLRPSRRRGCNSSPLQALLREMAWGNLDCRRVGVRNEGYHRSLDGPLERSGLLGYLQPRNVQPASGWPGRPRWPGSWTTTMRLGERV